MIAQRYCSASPGGSARIAVTTRKASASPLRLRSAPMAEPAALADIPAFSSIGRAIAQTASRAVGSEPLGSELLWLGLGFARALLWLCSSTLVALLDGLLPVFSDLALPPF